MVISNKIKRYIRKKCRKNKAHGTKIRFKLYFLYNFLVNSRKKVIESKALVKQVNLYKSVKMIQQKYFLSIL